MKWKLSKTAFENARAKLPKLAGKYFRAGRKATDKHRTPKQLHKFRLETKQFRYALELFTPIYGPSLERHLASLRGIQDALGKISDHQTVLEMIAGDKELEAKVHKAQRKKIREFRNEWKKLDSADQLERWRDYLAHVPSGRKRSRGTAKSATQSKSTTARQT